MALGQIYRGKNVRFKFEGKPLYHATSCKISISSKLEEIATKDTDGTVSVPDGYSWALSAEALVADKPAGATHVDTMDIVDLQLAGTEIDVEFTTDVTGEFIFTGKIYCTQSDIDATTGSAVSGSFSFTGNGNLTKALVGTILPVMTSEDRIFMVKDAAFSLQLASSPAATVYTKVGTLPTGITLTSGGLLAGTPTVSGLTTVTIKGDTGPAQTVTIGVVNP